MFAITIARFVPPPKFNDYENDDFNDEPFRNVPEKASTGVPIKLAAKDLFSLVYPSCFTRFTQRF